MFPWCSSRPCRVNRSQVGFRLLSANGSDVKFLFPWCSSRPCRVNRSQVGFRLLSANGSDVKFLFPWCSSRPCRVNRSQVGFRLHSASDITDNLGSGFVLFIGSRTPHYGAMTPSHDGSRTPLHGGAWDPTQPNTPARPSDDFDYNFDNPTPSPGVRNHSANLLWIYCRSQGMRSRVPVYVSLLQLKYKFYYNTAVAVQPSRTFATIFRPVNETAW